MSELTVTESRVLALLYEHGSLTVHQVTRRLQREDGSFIRFVLDDLTQRGYLRFLEGQGNNRRYAVVEALA